MNVNTEPFRHVVLDGIFSPYLVAAASAAWPEDKWSGWYRYDDANQNKRTCNLWGAMPAACRTLLVALMTHDLPHQLIDVNIAPDPLLWGAGLSSMGAGEHLAVHLDHDIHPKTGLMRRVNAILYLGHWHPTWGGRLQLWDSKRLAPQVEVLPIAGRLVLFETSDVSYHAVSPVTCPEEVRRKALSVYWHTAPEGTGKRPRAEFVGGKPGGGAE